MNCGINSFDHFDSGIDLIIKNQARQEMYNFFIEFDKYYFSKSSIFKNEEEEEEEKYEFDIFFDKMIDEYDFINYFDETEE